MPPGQRAQFDRSAYKRGSRLTGEGSVLRIPRLSVGLAAVSCLQAISHATAALAPYTLGRRVLRAASADALAASLASADRRAVALRTKVRRVSWPTASVE